MTFLPFLLNRSRLPICSYNFFLFWPVPLKSVKKRKKKKSIYACILRDKISEKKKKYYFSLFWPVTLQTLNGSSTVLVSTQQVSPMTFLPFLLNRSRLPICSYNFFFFWPVTLQTLKGLTTVQVRTSQSTRLNS